ncbi:MAG: 50S ribosomal protein L29 [Candidatus Magasanikbacteria bacterium]|nr:50S ribosomal protein L29 [Candidatus Magasanikbacteria bacterium]
MEFADLKNKSEKELRELLAEQRDELRELRFKASEKQLKNVKAIPKCRKAIARILTLLTVKNKTQS